MRLEGRRIHIAGSASAHQEPGLVRYAHNLVNQLVRALAKEGATFVLGVGKEPLADSSDASSLPIIFDYTAMDALNLDLQEGRVKAVGEQGRLIATVGTNKTDAQIPSSRSSLWENLKKADAVRLDFVDAGWVSGAVRRMRQAKLGDVLIALGGGEGVEHLAQLYALAGKPVIPLDLQLGSSSDDGSGGAAYLARRALADPLQFARYTDANAAGVLLSDITTRNGQRAIEEVVDAVVALLDGLASPTVFYVRLLNPTVAEYNEVEDYFRNVVDPVVARYGYDIVEMGRGTNKYAWMNEAIFDSLHYSSVVFVDLTGLRTNCFMELGYALGHGQRVIVTAKRGTELPFDISAFECHKWASADKDSKRIADLQEHWQRNINRPPLVKERDVL